VNRSGKTLENSPAPRALELAVPLRMSTSVVPLADPSLRYSSQPFEGDSAEKTSLPRKFVMTVGEEPGAPDRRSTTIFVPEVVPSVTQSSLP